ncbi:MAG TPA: cysteine desulfurase family protein [Candidatus Saccharimonadales bacterium]|nr:cysteine desulfurase family protein [Candidatus Saccharimonadales bacterium]
MPTKKTPIYLDYAAATPLDPVVLAAMEPYYADYFYNPSAAYAAAQNVRKALETARADAAHWLGAKPSEIIFTAGGTESTNLAIHGVMRKYPKGNVIVSAIEHDAVLMPAQAYDCRIVSVQADGRIDLKDLQAKIDDQTTLVSIGYANNEIGVVQPIREISRLISEIRRKRQQAGNTTPIYFHTDACQAANYLDLHVARLGVDLMSLDGSKIYGPKQTGCLYVRAGTVLEPLISGGHQEFGLRSGTENVAGDIGFAKALGLAQAMRKEESERLQKLQTDFVKRLEASIPHVVINGSKKYRLPNNVHVTIPGQDNERLLFELDEAGVQAAAGSACNASDTEASHVLKALGLSESTARASLRFAMGRGTTSDMISRTMQLLQAAIQEKGVS